MRKFSLLSSAALTCGLLLSGGTALAAPPALTCGQAEAAVVAAEGAVRTESAEARAAEAAVAEARAPIAGLEEAVEAAIAADNAAGLEEDSAVTIAAKLALTDARRALTLAEGTLVGENDQLEDAQAALGAAIDRRNRACAASVTTNPVPPPVADLDCPDFPNQAAAQIKLLENRADPHGLDSDKDGTACEEFFAAPPTTTSTARAPLPTTNQNNLVIEVDNDPNDGVTYRPNVSGGIATGAA